MIPIKSARIWKTGKGYVITVPKEYVRNGVLQISKRYSITLEEESEQPDNQTRGNANLDTKHFGINSGVFLSRSSSNFYKALQSAFSCSLGV